VPGLDKMATRGLSVVQDPAEARMPAMPEAAIRLRQPDLILDLRSIHSLLLEMGKIHAERQQRQRPDR
jgi:two-component system chemotaxis response regulator CheB